MGDKTYIGKIVNTDNTFIYFIQDGNTEKSKLLISNVKVLSHYWGQYLVVTPIGLVNGNDSTKTYIVLNVEDKTAKQLYDNAINYINHLYKSPDDVIKGKEDGKYLKFITHVSDFTSIPNVLSPTYYDCDYTTELSFKDGKVKYEIIVLDIYVISKGIKLYLFISGSSSMFNKNIFNKKGELKRPNNKNDIENYFKTQINGLMTFLKENNIKHENW